MSHESEQSNIIDLNAHRQKRVDFAPPEQLPQADATPELTSDQLDELVAVLRGIMTDAEQGLPTGRTLFKQMLAGDEVARRAVEHLIAGRELAKNLIEKWKK